MSGWLRAVIALALLLCWAVPAIGQDSPICHAVDYAPPASLAITRGQITGAPGEHTTITGTIPKDGEAGAQSGYLVTGDKVDFVAACRGFSYIRYHGHNQTTTGWVDTRKVQLKGKSFIPLPPNVNQICSDAQSEIDRTSLTAIDEREIPEGAHLSDDGDPINAAASSYQPVDVQGRTLAVVRIFGGGSCHSRMVKVWTSDFKRSLSPDDVNSRNPENLIGGGNGWSMGLEEDAVLIDGQPLIRSSYGQDFDLSSIDRTGDTQFLCHGRLSPNLGKPILTEGDPGLCGDLPEAATPVAMEPAAGKYTVSPQAEAWVTREADQWGMVDLDNSGKDRPIGVVNYTHDTARGCGTTFEAQVPVVLRGDVVSADQISAALKPLFGDEADHGEVRDTSRIRIVRLHGQTYVEILDTGLMAGDEIAKAPIQSVWKFDADGPKQVCRYRTRHFEVKPVSPNEM
jgi:hypothetical protein